MRLPADAALIVLGLETAEPAGALIAAWSAERLPIARFATVPAAETLEAALEPANATTLVLCGGERPALEALARTAAGLGYRLFVVAEDGPDARRLAERLAGLARVVGPPTALEAAALARFRQRWREAREKAG